MRDSLKRSAKAIPSHFFVKYNPRPVKAYHLRLPHPVTWTYARDVQNAIITAYQEHHHNSSRRPLPPTFISLQFKPVFTYGRRRGERPSMSDRHMLEGLPGPDGSVAETRMAWHRDTDWRYHGPGQVHCWMVADLDDWNWEYSDVAQMMTSTLKEMIGYYLPSRGSQLQSAIAMPFSEPHLPLSAFPDMLDESLTTMELHENNYKVISYGSSINVYAKQTIDSSRLSRYGLSAPKVTTLQERGWVNKEPIYTIQDRFVAEMTKRIGTFPEQVDIHFLAQKLKAYIPTADLAKDKYRRVDPVLVEDKEGLKDMRETEPEMDMGKRSIAQSRPLQFAPVSIRPAEDSATDDELFVPTWGQYVRSATRAREWQPQEPPTTPDIPLAATFALEPEPPVLKDNPMPESGSRKAQDDDLSQATIPPQAPSQSTRLPSERLRVSTIPTVAADKAPPEVTKTPPTPRLSVLEQSIQWSSSNEIRFIPHTIKEAQSRRIVVSPREVQDHLYLDDPLLAAKKTHPGTFNDTVTTPKRPGSDKMK